MSLGLKELIDHDLSDDCPVCRAHDVVEMVLVPAAAAWELKNELPRFSIALHGAAGLLGAMLEEAVPPINRDWNACPARLSGRSFLYPFFDDLAQYQKSYRP